MMKYFLLFLFSFFYNSFFSQNYIDIIAQESCSCIEKLPEIEGKEAKTMRMGLCMIEAAGPYKVELYNDHAIDFSKINESAGEELGLLIGMKMASFCPEILMEMATDQMNDSEDESEDLYFEGKVISIDTEGFVYFTIKDENGRVSKYYWLTYVESEMNLENSYESLLGREVVGEYRVIEFFDPRIKEYRNMNVLSYIDL